MCEECDKLRNENKQLKSELLLRQIFGPPKRGDPAKARAGADDLRQIEAAMRTVLMSSHREKLLSMAGTFDRLVHEMIYWQAWTDKLESLLDRAMKTGLEPLRDEIRLALRHEQPGAVTPEP